MTLDDIVKRDLAALMWAKQQLEAEVHIERARRQEAETNLAAAMAQINQLTTDEVSPRSLKNAANGHAAGHP